MDEAMRAIRQAQAVDPLSLIINTEVGRLLYFLRRYDAAIAQYSRVLEMDSNFALAHLHLGTALVQQGRYTEAIAAFHKAASVGGAAPAANLGRAYALAGQRPEAEQIFQRLITESEGGLVPPFAMAVLYTSLGDHERAISWLEGGVAARGPLFLKVDPVWDVLRPHPRFQAVVLQAGLTP